MVCQVKFKTKKELKEAVEDGVDFFIEDPSIMNPKMFNCRDIKEGENICVTFHPARTYFATIERKKGKLVVK